MLNLNIYGTWGNLKKQYKNKRIKNSILSQIHQEEFQLHDSSHFLSDISNYFEFMIKEYINVLYSSTISIEMHINRV